jgi:hypothetical protein
VQVVQPAQEEQVGDLLDHLERVGDAAGPEGVPDLVDLALDWTGDLRTRKITPANRPVADGRTVRPPTTPCGCFAENALNGYYRPEPAVAAQEIEPDERQRTHQ